MDPMTLTLAQQLAVLNALKAAGPPAGALVGAKLHLAISVPADIVQSNLAMWEEADFTGYASGATAFGPAYLSPLDGKAYVSSPSVLFTSGVPAGADPFVSNTLLGWYLSNTAGDTVLGGGRFSEPVAVTKPAQGVEVGVDIPYGG